MTNSLASQQPAPIPEEDEHSCPNCDGFVHVPEGLEFSRSAGDICNNCKDERIARLEVALTALRDFMWAEGYADQTAVMRQAGAALGTPGKGEK
jgi:hypothetical protein